MLPDWTRAENKDKDVKICNVANVDRSSYTNTRTHFDCHAKSGTCRQQYTIGGLLSNRKKGENEIEKGWKHLKTAIHFH